MSGNAPSRIADKFMVRFPEGMRDRLAAAAKENRRSMNAELIIHLERALPEPASWALDPSAPKQTERDHA